MAKYNYLIEETLSRTVTVNADSEKEAYRMVRKMYKDCNIILSSSDYCSTEFLLIAER